MIELSKMVSMYACINQAWKKLYVCMYKSIYIGYRITRIYAHDSWSKELCVWLAVFVQVDAKCIHLVVEHENVCMYVCMY